VQSAVIKTKSEIPQKMPSNLPFYTRNITKHFPCYYYYKGTMTVYIPVNCSNKTIARDYYITLYYIVFYYVLAISGHFRTRVRYRCNKFIVTYGGDEIGVSFWCHQCTVSVTDMRRRGRVVVMKTKKNMQWRNAAEAHDT